MINKYAILNEENVVLNVILLDDTEYSIDELIALTPESDHAVKVDNNGEPFIGWKYVDGWFQTASPHNGWVWNSAEKQWEAPVAKPLDRDYVWNNSTLAWDLTEAEKQKDIIAAAQN